MNNESNTPEDRASRFVWQPSDFDNVEFEDDPDETWPVPDSELYYPENASKPADSPTADTPDTPKPKPKAKRKLSNDKNDDS